MGRDLRDRLHKFNGLFCLFSLSETSVQSQRQFYFDPLFSCGNIEGKNEKKSKVAAILFSLPDFFRMEEKGKQGFRFFPLFSFRTEETFRAREERKSFRFESKSLKRGGGDWQEAWSFGKKKEKGGRSCIKSQQPPFSPTSNSEGREGGGEG